LSVLLVLLCLLTLAGLMYTGVIWPNSLFVTDYSVRGIDVSNHQRQIDRQSVARSGEYTFAFIKATEGKSYKDAYFQENWRGAGKYGLQRGAYHFYIEDLSGVEQADNYISMVPEEAGMLPPVLDLEVNGRDRQAMVREIKIFLDRLAQHYGMKPIIYTDHERYAEYIQGNFEGYPIWMTDTLTPIQWSNTRNWTFWQYCSRGHVAGITEYVDLNVFYGNKDQLRALTSRSSPR
jgi:lysozyme